MGGCVGDLLELGGFAKRWFPWRFLRVKVVNVFDRASEAAPKKLPRRLEGGIGGENGILLIGGGRR